MGDIQHRRLAKCQWCDRFVHFKDLVRVQVPYERPGGSNYFLYSSYTEPYWTSTGTRNVAVARTETEEPSFADSFGPDSYVCTDALDADHLRNPIVTWDGLAALYNATTVDCTYMEDITFSCEFGFKEDYHDETKRNVRAGLSIAGIAYRHVNKMTRNNERIWFTVPVSEIVDPTIVSCYIWCDGGKWWADAFQLSRGMKSPGAFYSTNGAVVDYSVSERATGVVNMCKECRKKLKTYKSVITI